MMEIGYQAKDIIKITNIPNATVYRIVDKLRSESKLDFKELMEKDYLYKYQQNLANLNKTIVWCNEQMPQINTKYDDLGVITKEALDAVEGNKHISKAHLISNLITIQANRIRELAVIVAQRDKAVGDKARLFNQGPVVYRVNEYVEHKMQNIPPMLNEGIKVEDVKLEEEPIPILTSGDISAEDKEILAEMEADEIYDTSDSEKDDEDV